MSGLGAWSAFASILATAGVGWATTIHVPADSSTIQGGINGAVDGDTVMVSTGLYCQYSMSCPRVPLTGGRG